MRGSNRCFSHRRTIVFFHEQLFLRLEEVLGLLHWRGHDLRRTLISLARMDRAWKDIPSFPWEARCSQGAKLKVHRHERRQLVRLPLPTSAEKVSLEAPDGARGLATAS
jgi:hypothetical protein